MKITIARECGCYGDEVGQVLADRLNVPLYNKKTLTELAKKKGILEHYPDYFGENPAGTLLAVIAEDDGEDSVVHRTPRKVLDELIGETSCILIGRAGNYAYRKENDVVRVFLSGDRESRIHHLMEKHKVKRHEAEHCISWKDTTRPTFPEPSIRILFPGFTPCRFIIVCAAPAPMTPGRFQPSKVTIFSAAPVAMIMESPL